MSLDGCQTIPSIWDFYFLLPLQSFKTCNNYWFSSWIVQWKCTGSSKVILGRHSDDPEQIKPGLAGQWFLFQKLSQCKMFLPRFTNQHSTLPSTVALSITLGLTWHMLKSQRSSHDNMDNSILSTTPPYLQVTVGRSRRWKEEKQHLVISNRWINIS